MNKRQSLEKYLDNAIGNGGGFLSLFGDTGNKIQMIMSLKSALSKLEDIPGLETSIKKFVDDDGDAFKVAAISSLPGVGPSHDKAAAIKSIIELVKLVLTIIFAKKLKNKAKDEGVSFKESGNVHADMVTQMFFSSDATTRSKEADDVLSFLDHVEDVFLNCYESDDYTELIDLHSTLQSTIKNLG